MWLPEGLENTPLTETDEKLQFFWTFFYVLERSIFQIFWKPHCCTKSLFLELETSNFGYLLIF